MRTDLAASAWSAPQEAAVFLSVDVDWAERRCGERGKHARVLGNSDRDDLAAAQPGTDDLVGVGAIDLGAGRTLRGAAGLSGDRQDAAGFVNGGVAVEQFAGGPVDVVDATAQQNRSQAAARMASGACGGIGEQRVVLLSSCPCGRGRASGGKPRPGAWELGSLISGAMPHVAWPELPAAQADSDVALAP